MNLRRFRWLILLTIVLLSVAVYAQDDSCEIEKAEYIEANQAYNSALEKLKDAEVIFKPVQQFYEANAEITDHPIEKFATLSLKNLATEKLKDLAGVDALCKTNGLSYLFCTVVEACVDANTELKRDPFDMDCTVADITRTQLAPIAVPAIMVIYRDEFREKTEIYENAVANLIDAENRLNTAIQARTKCFEQAKIYNRVCDFGPPSRLAIGVNGKIDTSPTDEDMERPNGAPNTSGEPIGASLHVAPSLNSNSVIQSVLAGSEFLVKDGPQCADGVTWWYVSLGDVKTDDTREGWLPEGNSASYFTQPSLSDTVPTLTNGMADVIRLNCKNGGFADLQHCFQLLATRCVLPNNLFNLTCRDTVFKELEQGTSNDQPTDTPVSVTCDGAPTSRLVIGEQGRVTPGQPNNLHDTEPTKNGTKIGQIPAGTIFSVLEGPVCADKFAWWKVDFNGLVGWTIEGQGVKYALEAITTKQPTSTMPTTLKAFTIDYDDNETVIDSIYGNIYLSAPYNVCGQLSNWNGTQGDILIHGLHSYFPDLRIIAKKVGDDLHLEFKQIHIGKDVDYHSVIHVTVTIQNFHEGDFGFTGTDFSPRAQTLIVCEPDKGD